MDFKAEVARIIAAAAQMDADEIELMLEVPAHSEMGDLALPCFRLSKILKKSPNAIADELKEKIEPSSLISEVMSVSGYLNFFFARGIYAAKVLDAVAEAGETYGSSDMGKGKTVCLDYSSINIAKPFHIGHLLTTVIGNSLNRIYRFLGYRSVSINHLGDWGTQFGKMICAFKRWGNEDVVTQQGVAELNRLYVKFHEEAEKDSSLEDEGRAWFKKIEDGNPEALRLFELFKQITLKDVKRVYDILGVQFDSYAGESFYNDKMQSVIDELKEKGLLVQSEGAYVVNLDEYSLPPCLILKKDGATLYATRDLAAAFYRKKEYHFDKCLYVVAYQQNLHFKQWFKVVELMGYDWAKDLEHVAFGMVSLESGTLSTRKGNVVLLEDVLKAAIEKTGAVIEEKNPDIEDKQTVAKQVGVGAVVFSALLNNRIKDMVFSWDRALNFDGETGPYVQYTHARCASVLKKAPRLTGVIDPCELNNDEAFAVAKLLYDFPRVIVDAKNASEPSLITRYSVDLAQAFNKYYYEHRILNGEGAYTRVILVQCVKDVLKTALYLIGIAAPEQM